MCCSYHFYFIPYVYSIGCNEIKVKRLFVKTNDEFTNLKLNCSPNAVKKLRSKSDDEKRKVHDFIFAGLRPKCFKRSPQNYSSDEADPNAA